METNILNDYFIAKMVGIYLKVFKCDMNLDETKFTPFPTIGLSGDYSDFFMYDTYIVSKNEKKLLGFVGFRNRLCT